VEVKKLVEAIAVGPERWSGCISGESRCRTYSGDDCQRLCEKVGIDEDSMLLAFDHSIVIRFADSVHVPLAFAVVRPLDQMLHIYTQWPQMFT
jgi:hypothetical protein